MTSRSLTTSEILVANSVFGDRIDYSKVRIWDRKWWFLQASNVVMTPRGEIYWPHTPVDCSQMLAHLLIHEMTHVYQHQRGVNVLLRAGWLQVLRFASFGRYDPYSFVYVPGKRFEDYNLEQQGDVAVAIHLRKIPNIILNP